MNAAKELADTAAIVTGSTGLLGRAIAVQLADAGAMVLINARTSADAANAVVKEIEASGGQAIAHLADVTMPEEVPEEVEGMVDVAIKSFGRLDILVNNVGGNIPGPVTQISYDDWCRVTRRVLDGAFLCTKYAVPHLAKHVRGAIINIGASFAHAGVANSSAVTAAKVGLAGLTGSLAVELAAQEITVNCVAPGRIERPGTPPAHYREMPVPVGREGKVEELVAMARFLCGPQSRFTTGQTFHVNGGWYVSIN